MSQCQAAETRCGFPMPCGYHEDELRYRVTPALFRILESAGIVLDPKKTYDLVIEVVEES